jgi:TetR/AcrR family transcriptional repressor of nem operon
LGGTVREPGYSEPAGRILDSAERLVQQRGFNGFSYADIATELGVTKPSLHYHFASKAELGAALIERYSNRFGGALEALDSQEGGAPEKLTGYTDLYLDVVRNDRMCLCGMLAAEYQTLPQPMRDAVRAFFELNETWLESVLDQGRSDESLRFAGRSRDTARMIISCLEGAMLVDRPYADPDRFQATAANLLSGLAASR